MKYAVDAGGPSGEPPAKRKMVPFNHATPKTVFQARQKLLFIEQQTVKAKAEIDRRWGPVSPLCVKGLRCDVCASLLRSLAVM